MMRSRYYAFGAALGVLLAGCGPSRFEAEMKTPPPLIEKIPVVAGIYIPPVFRDKVHQEKRFGTDYEINIGKAQSAGFERLMTAMFDRVVMLQGTDSASITDPAIRGVLEPVLEDFSFVTPRDAGSPFYAVSLKYRINLYKTTGQLSESWSFTGYASVPSNGLPTEGSEPLRQATALAMRDAGAKLAAEFREQAIARGLLPEGSGAGPEVEVPSSTDSQAPPPPTQP